MEELLMVGSKRGAMAARFRTHRALRRTAVPRKIVGGAAVIAGAWDE
jgi:hypothetical protein